MDLLDGRGPMTRLCLKKTPESPCRRMAHTRIRDIVENVTKKFRGRV